MSDSGFRATGPADLHNEPIDFAALDPREQLCALLRERVAGKPFSELYAVTLDHHGAAVMGHVLLDTLEDAGYSIDDYDAVGALTAASVPLVGSMIQAAASRGENLDGFVMDFVFPSIKGPSIKGKRVLLLDAWLSEKSYVQTSSLVTLRNGNELSLDFSIVEHEGASVVAVASLVGGVGKGADEHEITVISPVDGARHEVPFIQVFHESDLAE
ncbi:orotate phosphoribosyltransferase [Bifidobacterium stellenboschense]|uniref:Orotate phosphoribosyltransferase n=1 Tax=Bifidobacterium stellenboschense TaxID=762211 RepID=A0A087DN42_9BIFI|nr:orotate phosphoribosyltransferase [Bifidobacterium stellenboschense]KFI96942.1 orotate phosphoribosyltransferase [Bifidobacterium stellenboschense]